MIEHVSNARALLDARGRPPIGAGTVVVSGRGPTGATPIEVEFFRPPEACSAGGEPASRRQNTSATRCSFDEK